MSTLEQHAGPDIAPSSKTSRNLQADDGALRFRLIFAALVGVVPIAIAVQWSDLLVGGTMMAGPFPPLAASLLWCALLLLQFVLKRQGRTPIFRRSEMLALLGIWIAANMVVGRGLLHPLLASLAGPTYYARSGAIAKAVPRDLPDWLAVTRKEAARGFFEGHGAPVPWDQWRGPLITWGLFFLPFLMANVSLCVLFEQVWVRHERLSFPLVMLPIEAVNENQNARSATTNAGFRRAIVAGVTIPLLLHGFGVAHAYLPGIPCIPFFNDVSIIVTAQPWTAMRPLYLNFYPLLVGLTFLAPTDVTFSVWFFLLLNKLEMVIARASGWSDGAAGGGMNPFPPYLEEQSAGAFIALFCILVWNARTHLKRIAGSAVRVGSNVVRGTGAQNGSSTVVGEDYRSYRTPFWGFVLGVCGVLFWCFRTGLPLWFAACFFGFYFAVALVLSRLMAEGGVSWILAPILPDKLIFGLLGSGMMTQTAVTRLALQVQHLRDTRQMISPAVMQTGKLRDEGDIPRVGFYLLLFACMLLALVVGTGTALPLFYGHGALVLAPNSDGLMMSASVVPLTGINQASSRLLHPIRASAGGASGLVFGLIITLILSILRTHFLWWPLHPLGYALTGTLQLGYANKMLCSIFLGWMFKMLALRFGGARGYRYLRGAALGLVLGDLIVGGILKVLDAVLGPSGYAIF